MKWTSRQYSGSNVRRLGLDHRFCLRFCGAIIPWTKSKRAVNWMHGTVAYGSLLVTIADYLLWDQFNNFYLGTFWWAAFLTKSNVRPWISFPRPLFFFLPVIDSSRSVERRKLKHVPVFILFTVFSCAFFVSRWCSRILLGLAVKLLSRKFPFALTPATISNCLVLQGWWWWDDGDEFRIHTISGARVFGAHSIASEN